MITVDPPPSRVPVSILVLLVEFVIGVLPITIYYGFHLLLYVLVPFAAPRYLPLLLAAAALLWLYWHSLFRLARRKLPKGHEVVGLLIGLVVILRLAWAESVDSAKMLSRGIALHGEAGTLLMFASTSAVACHWTWIYLSSPEPHRG